MSDLDENPNEKMSDIDKITLELLINHTQYKKYIQKQDPAKYSENQLYLGKIRRYQNKIRHMFLSLLENPDQQITTDIKRDFTCFVKTCIQYYELKEMENTLPFDNELFPDNEVSSERDRHVRVLSQDNRYCDPIDDDVMFENMENITFSFDNELSSENTRPPALVPGSGVLAKPHTSGKIYAPKYTMDSYVYVKEKKA